ncbi:MAG: ferrous iron transport protein A [Spirochaetales bacterium]|nr:ferrous iron transport protein A [Spirochaetales bacterium]
MAQIGEVNTIKSIGGKTDTKNFLEHLGFHVHGTVQVISSQAGNVIVNIKDSRVAINKDLANKIMI